MIPLPTDLAGYQHIEDGVSLADDLYIPDGWVDKTEWQWAPYWVGTVIKDGLAGRHYRVYRKIPVPTQDGT